MPKLLETGRLAFRVEGDWWNAYWAPREDSMMDAERLGSVRINLALHPDVKAAFMATMRRAFGTVAKAALGVEATFGEPRPAPERERSGNA